MDGKRWVKSPEVLRAGVRASGRDLAPDFGLPSLLSNLLSMERSGPSFGQSMAIVLDFAGRLNIVAGPAGLRRLVAGAVRDLGFCYYALVQHGDLEARSDGQILLHNYPRRWSTRFARARLHRVDPVQRAAAVAAIGFAWRDLNPEAPDSRHIMDAARAAGLGEGFTVPLHLAGERIASFSFVTAGERPLPRRTLLAAQLVAQLSYAAALGFARPCASGRGRLTPRQQECVILMAQGKTDWEIGRILELREDTVSKYLNDARRRFGVVRRTQLVLAALRFGEIGFSDLNWQSPP
ncbi:LuxR family transcriptional regulator, quorum-sensing system regulator CciR [Sphingomonas laterariae]|uniref:LuxR family transcriptional regulator, quorum-sensing system regulator CciR n=1 Tax=Edaphosphingomonas laterariae TaxID=861865 RepID=A0A239I3Q2_9SPHN|nr:LuxR family transcriptional regulator [Sphingomonas laterariae]SNS87918.1 LuxR family transcriptional regulator, quorum-sensing system regulator CciR [Sphingomonas laterariae]